MVFGSDCQWQWASTAVRAKSKAAHVGDICCAVPAHAVPVAVMTGHCFTKPSWPSDLAFCQARLQQQQSAPMLTTNRSPTSAIGSHATRHTTFVATLMRTGTWCCSTECVLYEAAPSTLLRHTAAAIAGSRFYLHRLFSRSHSNKTHQAGAAELRWLICTQGPQDEQHNWQHCHLLCPVLGADCLLHRFEPVALQAFRQLSFHPRHQRGSIVRERRVHLHEGRACRRRFRDNGVPTPYCRHADAK